MGVRMAFFMLSIPASMGTAYSKDHPTIAPSELQTFFSMLRGLALKEKRMSSFSSP